LYIFTEPLLTRWPFNKLVRKKALEVTMKHIHYEDENSRYLTIGCVEKVSSLAINNIDWSEISFLVSFKYAINIMYIFIRFYVCLLVGWKIQMEMLSRSILQGSQITCGFQKME
jgi:hypothetical protein